MVKPADRFFSSSPHGVCFSDCETKPLPYYSTSLQIGTLLCPVSLIYFLRGQYFCSKTLAALSLLEHCPTPEPIIAFTIRWAECGCSSSPSTCSRCEINLLRHDCGTSPSPGYSRPRLRQVCWLSSGGRVCGRREERSENLLRQVLAEFGETNNCYMRWTSWKNSHRRVSVSQNLDTDAILVKEFGDHLKLHCLTVLLLKCSVSMATEAETIQVKTETTRPQITHL